MCRLPRFVPAPDSPWPAKAQCGRAASGHRPGRPVRSSSSCSDSRLFVQYSNSTSTQTLARDRLGGRQFLFEAAAAATAGSGSGLRRERLLRRAGVGLPAAASGLWATVPRATSAYRGGAWWHSV